MARRVDGMYMLTHNTANTVGRSRRSPGQRASGDSPCVPGPGLATGLAQVQEVSGGVCVCSAHDGQQAISVDCTVTRDVVDETAECWLERPLGVIAGPRAGAERAESTRTKQTCASPLFFLSGTHCTHCTPHCTHCTPGTHARGHAGALSLSSLLPACQLRRRRLGLAAAPHYCLHRLHRLRCIILLPLLRRNPRPSSNKSRATALRAVPQRPARHSAPDHPLYPLNRPPRLAMQLL
jgi:hypothetical protein